MSGQPLWEREGYESYYHWQADIYAGMSTPGESWAEFWARYPQQYQK